MPSTTILPNGGRKIPGSVMVTVAVANCPETIMLPVLASIVVFEATEYVMVPLPTPLKPAVIVTQGTLLVAVQEQEPKSTTDTLLAPPLVPKATVAGLSW